MKPHTESGNAARPQPRSLPAEAAQLCLCSSRPGQRGENGAPPYTCFRGKGRAYLSLRNKVRKTTKKRKKEKKTKVTG